MNRLRPRRGGALVAALVTLLVVMLVASAIVRSRVLAHRQARQGQYELQAQWLAEAGVERAQAQLTTASGYRSETWQPALVTATGSALSAAVEIRVEPAENTPDARRVIVTATYPNDRWRRVVVRREYNIQNMPEPAPPEENP